MGQGNVNKLVEVMDLNLTENLLKNKFCIYTTFNLVDFLLGPQVESHYQKPLGHLDIKSVINHLSNIFFIGCSIIVYTIIIKNINLILIAFNLSW
jgi:hypothetical protein